MKYRKPMSSGRTKRSAADKRTMAAVRVEHPVCEACRMKESAETHHIVSEKTGGPTEGWNLLALCHTCHQAGFHQMGWLTFCAAWPHLSGKIAAARIRMGRKT